MAGKRRTKRFSDNSDRIYYYEGFFRTGGAARAAAYDHRKLGWFARIIKSGKKWELWLAWNPRR